VRVEPDITVFVPSAFRPGEGFRDCPDPDPECNSTFKPNASGYATIEVIVFNRWGQEVYRSNDISTGWNGTIQNKGEVCPQDVYIYMIYATSFNGKQYKYSGSVTLLR
jgi:gliding motility-associated-like protein